MMDTIEPQLLTAIAYVQAHWPYFVIGLAIALAAVLLLRRTNRKASVKISKDVLDEGADPAVRNQALIDAPSKTAGAAKIAQAEPAPVTAKSSGGSAGSDELTQIKGLGPKLAATLRALGITSVAQIADWDAAEIERIDAKLGRFQGRIARDNWVEQAKHLSAGDADGFTGKFGANS